MSILKYLRLIFDAGAAYDEEPPAYVDEVGGVPYYAAPQVRRTLSEEVLAHQQQGARSVLHATQADDVEDVVSGEVGPVYGPLTEQEALDLTPMPPGPIGPMTLREWEQTKPVSTDEVLRSHGRRVVQAMIRGEEYDPSRRSRRSTRGKGISILHGEIVEWSSVHEEALAWLADPGHGLWNDQMKSDLYSHLRHLAGRGPLTVWWKGGRIQVFEAGSTEAKKFTPFLVRDAIDLSADWNVAQEEQEQAELHREYAERWKRYVRSQGNVVGIPLMVRWKIFVGRWRLRLGLSAELPPRA
jgi:hypothetical protein